MVGKREINSRAYLSSFNFKGTDQQKKVGEALGRRAESPASREDADDAAGTCCCSTSRRTISTSIRCARSRMRCSISPDARW